MDPSVSHGPQLVNSVPVQFARFQLCPDLHESVCLRCCAVIGVSSHPNGLIILEQAHRCSGARKQSARTRRAA